MAEFGEATILTAADGSLVVERADDVVGVTVQLLAEFPQWGFGPDGLLWLTPSGEYRYRPLRFATRVPGVLVCERVRT